MRSISLSGIPSALKRILRPCRQLVEADCSLVGSHNWGTAPLVLAVGEAGWESL